MIAEGSTEKAPSFVISTSTLMDEIHDKDQIRSLDAPDQGIEVGVPAVDDVYPEGFKLGIIIFALCLSVFCVALDNTIIATAIPHITDDFHTLQDIGWYGSAYLLTTCAFQLFYGKLYASFNIKIVFLIALFIFEVGSVICGTAPNTQALIIGRAVAGLGAAGLFSGTFIIIAHSCPVHKRPVYTGIAGAMYGLASVIGPLIGGAFTVKVTWRWCFYINLPLGGLSAIIVILLLNLKTTTDIAGKKEGIPQTIWSLDPIGTLLFVPSIVCLLLALQWGGTTYAWNNSRVIALFVVFGVLLLTFIAVQFWMGEKATVPPRIAAQRTIASSSVFSILIGGEFFLLTYFLPVWFQAIKGVDAWHSGVNSIPLILSMTIGIILSGGLTTKFGYWMPYVCASVVLTSIGTGLLTTLAPNTSTGKWIGYQIIFGFGCGLAFQLPQIAAGAVLPLKDVAQGVSITFFAETLGGAFFVSIGDNVLDNKLIEYIKAMNIPSVDPKVVVKLGATQLRTYVPVAYLQQTVQAYNHALIKTLQIALVLACLSLFGAVGMEWKSVHKPVADEKTEAREEVSVEEV